MWIKNEIATCGWVNTLVVLSYRSICMKTHFCRTDADRESFLFQKTSVSTSFENSLHMVQSHNFWLEGAHISIPYSL